MVGQVSPCKTKQPVEAHGCTLLLQTVQATVATESSLARETVSVACEFVLGSSAVVFLRVFCGSQLAQRKKLGGPLARMASKASSSKGGEELVGQELARSLWTQGLSEPEAGHDISSCNSMLY